MRSTLSKASKMFPECSAMVKKLRAMTYNAEEQLRSHKNQASFLVNLAGRTTPKGLHCLSMRLTTEYFALQPEEQELPNQHKFQNPDLHHFAVFSDNVLACSAVVNSTVSTSTVSCSILFLFLSIIFLFSISYSLCVNLCASLSFLACFKKNAIFVYLVLLFISDISLDMFKITRFKRHFGSLHTSLVKSTRFNNIPSEFPHLGSKIQKSLYSLELGASQTIFKKME